MNQTEEADKFEQALLRFAQKGFVEDAWRWVKRQREPVVRGYQMIQCVHIEGGHEGDGELHFVVVKHTDAHGNETLWKKNGWYASYDGAYLDGSCDKVEARQVMVTRYEKAGENG